MTRKLPQKENTDSTFAFVLLFLYTAAVLIRPHEMFIESRHWIIIKILAILCCLTVIVAQRPLKLYPQHWMLLALLPLIILSGFFNGSGTDGIDQAQKLLVSSIIPLFLYSNCITSIKRQHWLMIVCLIAVMFMIHNGYFQQSSYLNEGWAFDTQGMTEKGIAVKRITYLGFFHDPNDLGMFFVMCIPFVVYFYKKGRFFLKISMLMTLSIIGYGIYVTGSRGTMLGAGSLIGVYFLVTYAGPKLFVAAVALAPIAATVVASLQRNIDASATGRLEAWYAAILMMLSNPVFGIGKGRFAEEHGRTAHNSYMLILGELGIPGYSLWGGALVFTVLTGYKFIKYNNKQKILYKENNTNINMLLQNEYAMNQTLFFSMIGYMITGFFLSRTYTLLLFIFMGMTLASHTRLANLEPDLKQYLTTKIALRCMLYCWVIIIAVYITLKMGLR